MMKIFFCGEYMYHNYTFIWLNINKQSEVQVQKYILSLSFFNTNNKLMIFVLSQPRQISSKFNELEIEKGNVQGNRLFSMSVK